jgi:hypothetical protein
VAAGVGGRAAGVEGQGASVMAVHQLGGTTSRAAMMEWPKRTGNGRPAQGCGIEGGPRGEALRPDGDGAGSRPTVVGGGGTMAAVAQGG